MILAPVSVEQTCSVPFEAHLKPLKKRDGLQGFGVFGAFGSIILLVDKLVAQGLVERVPSNQDRRQINVTSVISVTSVCTD